MGKNHSGVRLHGIYTKTLPDGTVVVDKDREDLIGYIPDGTESLRMSQAAQETGLDPRIVLHTQALLKAKRDAGFAVPEDLGKNLFESLRKSRGPPTAGSNLPFNPVYNDPRFHVDPEKGVPLLDDYGRQRICPKTGEVGGQGRLGEMAMGVIGHVRER